MPLHMMACGTVYNVSGHTAVHCMPAWSRILPTLPTMYAVLPRRRFALLYAPKRKQNWAIQKKINHSPYPLCAACSPLASTESSRIRTCSILDILCTKKKLSIRFTGHWPNRIKCLNKPSSRLYDRYGCTASSGVRATYGVTQIKLSATGDSFIHKFRRSCFDRITVGSSTNASGSYSGNRLRYNKWEPRKQ